MIFSGRHSKGDPRVKPKQWANISSVRSNVIDWYNRNGMPAPVIYLPFWENAGQKVFNCGTITERPGYAYGTPTLTWGNSVLDCTDTNRRLAYTSGKALEISVTGGTQYSRILRNQYELNDQIITWQRGSGNDRVGWHIYGTDPVVSLGDFNIKKMTGPYPSDILTNNFFVWNSDSWQFYLNDGLLDSGLDGSFAAPGSWDYVGILDAAISSSYAFTSGYADCVGYFEEQLTADQIALLNEQPYAALQPRSITFHSFAAEAGGTTYPINRVFNGPFSGPFSGAL